MLPCVQGNTFNLTPQEQCQPLAAGLINIALLLLEDGNIPEGLHWMCYPANREAFFSDDPHPQYIFFN